MDTEKRFDIVAGPGKDVLIDAFKYAYTEGAKIPLSFTAKKENSVLPRRQKEIPKSICLTKHKRELLL